MRKKGVYIVSEAGCWNITSGANHHIKTGFEQLNRNFEIVLLLFFKEHGTSYEDDLRTSKPNKYAFYFKKWVRLPYLLIKNHIYFFKYLNMIKKNKPDFIYERASFLNYNGIIISRILKKKHFYEVNSVYFEENKSQFPKVLIPLIHFLENYFISKSNHVFFVGDLKRFYKRMHSYSEVQNGMELSYINEFELVEKPMNSSPVNIVFVGHLMPHHNIDVLLKVLAKLDAEKINVTMHFIGNGFGNIDLHLNHNSYHVYGSVPHDKIKDILKKMDIGVLANVGYFSPMKLFLYGASKLSIVTPRSGIAEKLFNDSEVSFYNYNDEHDLYDKIITNINSPERRITSSYNIYIKIKEKFTWEKIFDDISITIGQYL